MPNHWDAQPFNQKMNNHSTKEMINQSTKKMINQSTKKMISHKSQTIEMLSHSTKRWLIKQRDDQPMKHQTCWRICCLLSFLPVFASRGTLTPPPLPPRPPPPLPRPLGPPRPPPLGPLPPLGPPRPLGWLKGRQLSENGKIDLSFF